jgi:hypothetical protein
LSGFVSTRNDREIFVTYLHIVRGTAAATLILAFMSVAAPRDAEAAPAALDLRVGTTGYGADLDLGFTPLVGVRLGYSGFNYHRTIDNTNVSYDGTLKISDASAVLDWYPFAGGFHLSAGGVAGGLTLDLIGQPSSGTYTFNHDTYTSAQVGSAVGRIKFGNSLSPYVGLGWGNPTGGGHLHFLFDVGAIYGGTPDVSLAVQCGSAATAQVCSQLQADVLAEKQQLQSNVTVAKWYPVVNLGLAWRL